MFQSGIWVTISPYIVDKIGLQNLFVILTIYTALAATWTAYRNLSVVQPWDPSSWATKAEKVLPEFGLTVKQSQEFTVNPALRGSQWHAEERKDEAAWTGVGVGVGGSVELTPSKLATDRV